jgi:hypothetical protein
VCRPPCSHTLGSWAARVCLRDSLRLKTAARGARVDTPLPAWPVSQEMQEVIRSFRFSQVGNDRPTAREVKGQAGGPGLAGGSRNDAFLGGKVPDAGLTCDFEPCPWLDSGEELLASLDLDTAAEPSRVSSVPNGRERRLATELTRRRDAHDYLTGETGWNSLINSRLDTTDGQCPSPRTDTGAEQLGGRRGLQSLCSIPTPCMRTATSIPDAECPVPSLLPNARRRTSILRLVCRAT